MHFSTFKSLWHFSSDIAVVCGSALQSRETLWCTQKKMAKVWYPYIIPGSCEIMHYRKHFWHINSRIHLSFTILLCKSIMCFQFSIWWHAECYPSTSMWRVSHLFVYTSLWDHHKWKKTLKLSVKPKTNMKRMNFFFFRSCCSVFWYDFICEIAEENFTTGMSMKLQRNLHHDHSKVTPQTSAVF